MTTAHRPTWKAAVGQAQEGGWTAGGAPSASRSALDAAAHTKLKLRSQVIDKKEALEESLRKLEQAEAKVAPPKRKIVPEIEEEGRRRLLKQTADVDEEKIRKKYDDADDDDGDGPDSDGWNDSLGQSDDSDLDASDSESSEDDDDDDEEALQAELAKIRAEREAAKAAAETEEAKEEEGRFEEAALMGNPLLNAGAASSGKMKRRWNDDVVFRNQAKGEPELKKRFINDTVRNDFHKRFLNKFVR